MRILVTGAAGFFGVHTAKGLLGDLKTNHVGALRYDQHYQLIEERPLMLDHQHKHWEYCISLTTSCPSFDDWTRRLLILRR